MSVWAFLPAWAECLHTCEQVPDAHVSKCVVTFWLQGRELGCSSGAFSYGRQVRLDTWAAVPRPRCSSGCRALRARLVSTTTCNVSNRFNKVQGGYSSIFQVPHLENIKYSSTATLETLTPHRRAWELVPLCKANLNDLKFYFFLGITAAEKGSEMSARRSC